MFYLIYTNRNFTVVCSLVEKYKLNNMSKIRDDNILFSTFSLVARIIKNRRVVLTYLLQYLNNATQTV